MKVKDFRGNTADCKGFLVRPRHGSVGSFCVYGILSDADFSIVPDYDYDFDDEDTFVKLYECDSFKFTMSYCDWLQEQLAASSKGKEMTVNV
jgi:hypothetical protein